MCQCMSTMSASHGLSFSHCSYAREWQNKLKELQNCKAAAAAALLNSHKGKPVAKETSLSLSGTPNVSITPSFSKSPKKSPPRKQESTIKMDSNGALNLASSPSPTDLSSSAISMVASADSPASRTGRSPPSFASQSRNSGSFGVEICVVCGDRASGESSDPISL